MTKYTFDKAPNLKSFSEESLDDLNKVMDEFCAEKNDDGLLRYTIAQKTPITTFNGVINGVSKTCYTALIFYYNNPTNLLNT